MTLRGFGNHAPKKKAASITPDILLEIQRTVDFSSALNSTIWCAFILAFFMMARKSSVAPDTTQNFDTIKYLCRKDIYFSSYGIEVQLKYSKTN